MIELVSHSDINLRYPQLFAPHSIWGRPQRYSVKFNLFDEPPEPKIVGNVSIVPRISDKFVVIDIEGRGWAFPAGTLELGEAWIEGLRRETMEESGAEILSAHLIGGWEITVLSETPLRPQLPHPRFYRLLYEGNVRLVGHPEPVEGGESINEVRVATLEEAVMLLNRSGRPDIAELYRFVADQG